MALHRCTRCYRHVRPREASCPFCAAPLSTIGAFVPALVGLVAGVALLGCVESGDGMPAEGSSADASSSSGGETGDNSASGAITSPMTNGSNTTLGDDWDAGGDDYGGAEADSDWDPLETSDTSAESSSEGSTGDTDGESGSGSSGDTDGDTDNESESGSGGSSDGETHGSETGNPTTSG